jgi:hypothetical protein
MPLELIVLRTIKGREFVPIRAAGEFGKVIHSTSEARSRGTVRRMQV